LFNTKQDELAFKDQTNSALMLFKSKYHR